MNIWQSPVSSFGRRRPPVSLCDTAASAGSALAQFGGRQQFERHVRVLQHGDVFRGAVELLLRAEHLQRAAGAAFVLDAGVGAQRLQAVAAVFGEAHHAALVDRIARRVQFCSICHIHCNWNAVPSRRIASGACFSNIHLTAFSGTPGAAHGDA